MREKIALFMHRNMEYILMICFFAFYLFMQHRLVGMYYDDFGNASLSYGYDSSSIIGTNYTIMDLAKWSKFIYLNWGGRVIYALMLIPLLKTGAHVYMTIQVLIIVLTYMAMTEIARRYSSQKENKLRILIVMMIVYLILQGHIFSMGVYWASASCLYVWPLLPLMITIVIYLKVREIIEEHKRCSFKDWWPLLITIPLVTLSQEQLGGTINVLFVVYLVIDYIKKKKYFLKLDLGVLGYCILTFMLFLIAPGNWVRMDSNAEYASLNIFEKIKYSCPRVLSLMTDSGMRYFNLLLIIAGILVVMEIRKRHNTIYIVVSSMAIIPYMIVDIIDIYNTNIIGMNIRNICFVIFLIDMFFLLCNYFNDRNNVEFMAIAIAAVASVFCLIVSPSFAMRSCIPYVFHCMIMVAIIVNNEFRIIAKGSILAFGLFGVINASRIYKGYEDNYYMDNLNYDILSNYDGTSDCIYLLRYSNYVYRAQMSCDEGFEGIDYWIKEYFNIPQSTRIKWRSMDEYFEYAENNKLDFQYNDGFYDDEGNRRWAQDKANFTIENNDSEECIVQIDFGVSTGYEETSSVKLICNGNTVADMPVNNCGAIFEQTVCLQPGLNEFEIVTDAKQIDSGADQRILYMSVGKINYYPVAK